jgi:hypothetical protein
LHEVSLTPLPSNTQAKITAVKTMLHNADDLARVLHTAGLPDRLAKKIAVLGIKAVPGAEYKTDENLNRIAAMLRRQQRELKG